MKIKTKVKAGPRGAQIDNYLLKPIGYDNPVSKYLLKPIG